MTDEKAQLSKLTAKQLEALALVAEHRTNKEIARILEIAPKTVEQRVAGACRKLNVTTKAEAARIWTAHQNVPGKPLQASDHVATQPPIPARTMEPVGDLTFHDANAFASDAPWIRRSERPRMGVELTDLGPISRLAIVCGIGVGLVATILIVLGVAEALQDLL